MTEIANQKTTAITTTATARCHHKHLQAVEWGRKFNRTGQQSAPFSKGRGLAGSEGFGSVWDYFLIFIGFWTLITLWQGFGVCCWGGRYGGLSDVHDGWDLQLWGASGRGGRRIGWVWVGRVGTVVRYTLVYESCCGRRSSRRGGLESLESLDYFFLTFPFLSFHGSLLLYKLINLIQIQTWDTSYIPWYHVYL